MAIVTLNETPIVTVTGKGDGFSGPGGAYAES